MTHIVELTGPALGRLILELQRPDVHTVRVARDPSGVMIKINEGMWTPPLATRDPFAQSAQLLAGAELGDL